MKKINKKKLAMFILPILAIAMVTAGLVYYNIFSVTLNVNQPMGVTYDGDLNVEIPCNAGEVCTEGSIQLKNTGDVDKSIFITDISPLGVDVSYVGKMNFVKKDLDTWETIAGETANIEYTFTGEDFIVSEIPDDYTLIYYPNTDGDVFATNVANIIVLSEGANNIGDLPINLDVGDNYCTTGDNPNAEVCSGAKLWLIPGDSTSAVTDLTSWTNAENYLFETDLITYTVSSNGEILVPANSELTVYPQYDINEHIVGGVKTVSLTIA